MTSMEWPDAQPKPLTPVAQATRRIGTSSPPAGGLSGRAPATWPMGDWRACWPRRSRCGGAGRTRMTLTWRGRRGTDGARARGQVRRNCGYARRGRAGGRFRTQEAGRARERRARCATGWRIPSEAGSPAPPRTTCHQSLGASGDVGLKCGSRCAHPGLARKAGTPAGAPVAARQSSAGRHEPCSSPTTSAGRHGDPRHPGR